MSFKNLHTSDMTILFSNAPSFKVLCFLLFCFSLNTSFAQDCDNLTDGGTISGDEAGCNNPTFDPSPIISTAPATGGTGDIQYMWMRTTGDPNSPFNTWQIIPGATGESYDPAPIAQTTHYGRCSRRSNCTEYIGETNFVTKTISCCSFNSAISPLASTICPQETLAMSVSATGTGLSYLWEASGGSFDNAAIANPNYTMMMPGTYTITVTVSSADCTEVIETTVTVDNSLTVSIASNSDYAEINENIQLNSTSSDANVTYSWTATSGMFSNTTIANPTYSNPTAGSYQIFLTVSNTNGCTAVDTFDINVGTCAFTLTSTATEASCSGNDGSITITPNSAIGTVNYVWSQASIGNTTTPTGLAAGSYTVTATDENNCSASTTVTITTMGGLVLSPNITLPNCVGDNNGQIQVTVTGGTPGYTYNWSNNLPAANLVNNLAAGTYTLTVTDANGCQATGSYQITEPTPLVLSGSSTPPACGATNGTATVSAVGGSPNYTYLWGDAAMQTTATATNLAAGNYGVTVTDNNGCQNSMFITVDAGTASNIVVTPVVTNAGCGENNGAISLSITGGITPYAIQWNNGVVDNPNLADLAAGNYNVTVSDVNGCSTTLNITVDEVDGISLMVISTPMSCIFANDATATAMVAGATGAVSYAWSSNLGNSAMVTRLPAGTYRVTATDEAGCSASESITIASPTVLTALTTSTSSGCGSTVGSATVIPTGGTAPYTYLWSDGNNQTGQTATDLSPGTYSVTVTDLGGCAITSSATISSDLGLMVTLATTNVLCNSENTGTIMANVANGVAPYTYTWNNSLLNLSGFTGLSQGTYSVTVTDANGCFGVAEAKVHSAPLLVITPVVENASCDGNDGRVRLDVNGGTPDYSFAWGAPLNNFSSVATGLAPGAYEFTVTDENGCSVSDVVIIGQATGCNDTCVVIAGTISTTDPTTICAGDDVPDPITVAISGNIGTNSRWIITDAVGTILELPISNVFNFDGAGFGTCQIWNVTYNEAINGLTIGQNIASMTGCFALTNPISVIRQDCTPTCTVNGGMISTMDNTTICAGDGLADFIAVDLTGNSGENTQWVVTDESLNILELPTSNLFNFDGAGFGTCLIWSVSYTGEIGGLVVGQNAANLAGCTNISNSIRVVRQDCTPICEVTPSTITSNDPIVFCVGDGNPDSVRINLIVGTGDFSRFIITDTNATILAISSETIYDFETTAPGICILWNITYNDGVGGLIVGNQINGLNGCFRLSNALTIVRQDCQPEPCENSPEVILIATENTCGNENTATIFSTTTGGQAPYTYAWSNGATTADLDNLAAGDYSLTVTDANGCTGVSTANIMDGGVISVDIAPPNTICAGANTGSLTATVTGGQTPITYNWSNGGTTATLNNLATGTYNLTVTDNIGCTATTTATILEDTDFSVNIIANNRTVCPGESISFGIAPANPNLTYSWTATGGAFDDATSSSPMYTMMMPGDYDITVVASNGTCTATSTITVTILQGINVAATLSDVVCAGDNNGSISITASSANEPITYTWDNGIGNIASPTGLAPGTYNVTISDALNCSVTQTFTIGVTSNLNVGLTSTNLDCNGANNGSITANATGGVAPITYTWSNGGANTATLNNLAAGTYSITATDAMGCTQEASIELTEPTPLFVTIVNSAQGQVLCPGTSVNLTATPNDANLTYSWTATGGNFDDATIATPVYTMMMPGNYDITVVVSNGTCSYSATTNVIIGNGIDFSVNKTDISCQGETDGSISLTINSGAAPITYAWDGGIGNNPSPTGLAAGTYNVTLTDANNCQATTSVTIAAPNAIDIGLDGTNILCNGDANGAVNALVVGGTNPLSLTWSTGATGVAGISDLTPGTYGLTVTDDNGCTAIDSVTLTESPAFTLVATGANIGCLDDGQAYVTPSGGTAPYTYVWNDDAGQTTDTAFNLIARDYSVTVTDANGCLESATVSIVATADFTCSIVVLNDIETINGIEGELGVTVTGGSGNYTYSWNNGGMDSIITSLSTSTYEVTVTDDTGCSCVNSLTLLNPALLGNYVFVDSDSSGTQDAGEPGVEGVTLQLTGTTTYGEMIVRTTQTDADGFYEFPVPPGDYKVTVVDAFGYNFTSVNTGGDDAIDSDFDPATGMSQVVTLGPGDSNLTIDLGLLVGEGCNNVLLGGAIQSDETLCSSDADPSIITNLSFPTGGMGQLEYLWLKSDITMEYYPGHPAWMEIPNSNSPDYDPGVITKTTYFIRCTRRSGCDSYPGESNIVTKTVIDCATNPSAENLRTTIIDGQIALDWEGKIPYQNGHYIIEKSDNGTDFKVCGTIKSQISEDMETLHFMDDAPSFGENYYRIKTLVPAMPNSFSNIAIAKLKQSANQRVMVYPNPVQQVATIHFLEELDELAQVQIVSGFGQIIKTFEIDTANKRHQIDLSDLPSGMYYLKFNNRKLKRFGHKIYKIEE